jgi:GDPmannose 4,6-dehydratase
MIAIMEHEKADDWVVSTGEAHSVREFGEKVFKHFNMNFYDYLIEDESLKRPNEVPALLGDSTKIRTALGWAPEYTFDSLVKEMCEYDLEAEKKTMV